MVVDLTNINEIQRIINYTLALRVLLGQWTTARLNRKKLSLSMASWASARHETDSMTDLKRIPYPYLLLIELADG
jgi:hypothetical protein